MSAATAACDAILQSYHMISSLTALVPFFLTAIAAKSLDGADAPPAPPQDSRKDASGIPAPPSAGDLSSMWERYKGSLEDSTIAVLLITLGLFFCFMGKRVFKPFLVIAGFAAGVLLAVFGLSWFDYVIGPAHRNLISWIIIVVCGLLVAGACLYAWRIGVYAAAGLGGAALAVFVLSLKAGGVIENFMGRQATIIAFSALAIVAAIFLEDVAIVAATAISGALAATVGADFFLKTGFAVQVWDMIYHRTFTLSHFDNSMYYMFVATLILAVLGAVAQLLLPTKGFGRSG